MRLSVCCILIAAHAALVAQSPNPSPQQMRDLLQQTARIAALESQGAVPFRLTATFSTFDYLGKPAGDGTLEETWLRPGMSRRVVTLRGGRSEQVINDGAVSEVSTAFTGSFMERRVIAALMNAGPESAKLPEGATLDYRALNCPAASSTVPL